MISYVKALAAIDEHASVQAEEMAPHASCLGMVLAENIFADRDYPPFNRAAMDGYAVRVADLTDHDKLQVSGTVFAGKAWDEQIVPGCCVKIMTGAAVPAGADAVVRVEDTTITENMVCFDSKMVFRPGMNIASQGQDFKKGRQILQPGQRITTAVWSMLAYLGKSEVKVHKLPTTAILSTGDEICGVQDTVTNYQIRDSNKYSIKGFLDQYKIKVGLEKIIKDDKAELGKVIQEISDYDLIFITGGVSAGDADFVPAMLQEAGVTQIFHKVAIKPGKPIWFGQTRQRGIVFAMPGNPLSVQVALRIFVEPYLRKIFAMKENINWQIPLQQPRLKKTQMDEFFPCKINYEYLTLEQVSTNGSGDISTMMASDGIALHPYNVPDLGRHEKILFFPWRGICE